MTSVPGPSNADELRAFVDGLRRGVLDLSLYVVVADGDDRDVKNRNRIEKPRLLDAVLLDDLWDLIDAVGADL